jgi:hypothetical protein
MSFAAFNTAHRGLQSHFIAQALKNPAAAYVASMHFAKTRMGQANAPHIHLSSDNASQARMAALAMLRGTPAQRAQLVRQAKSLLVLLQVLKTMQVLQRPSTSAGGGTSERSPRASAHASGRSSRSGARSATNQQSRSKASPSSGPYARTRGQHAHKPQARPSDIPRHNQFKPACSDEAAPAQPDAHPIADPFRVLGLKADASPAEVKIAYRKAAIVNHPHMGGSAELMQELNKAYGQIMDQARKANK